MSRMKEADAKALFTFVANRIDIESIPLDDYKTYKLLSNGDTDGVYMMESNWDKYDLLQIKPKNFKSLLPVLHSVIIHCLILISTPI